MNIAIGKFGKSTIFSPKKWGMIGGDQESPVLITSLAQLNPDINFYLIGKSDFSRLDKTQQEALAPHGNIIDVWKDFDKDIMNVWEWPLHFAKENDIEFDFGIFYAGPTGTANIPNKCYKINVNEYAKTLESFEKYVGPINHLLNITDIPYVLIGEDYRYFPNKSRDLYNREKEILGTIKESGLRVKYNEYHQTEFIEEYVDVVPAHMDKLFLMGEKHRKLEISQRSNLMSIYSNGRWSTGGIPKTPIMEKWIHSKFDKNDWICYGEWDDNVINEKEYLNNYVEKPMAELQQQMLDTKYTFMIPITEGCASSKLWKMIYFGIIPFFHPLSDTSRNQIDDEELEILRPETPEELQKNIEYLENNSSEYKKVFDKLQKLLKVEYFNGVLLDNILKEKIAKYTDHGLEDLKSLRTGKIDYKLSSLFPKLIEKISLKTHKLF